MGYIVLILIAINCGDLHVISLVSLSIAIQLLCYCYYYFPNQKLLQYSRSRGQFLHLIFIGTLPSDKIKEIKEKGGACFSSCD